MLVANWSGVPAGCIGFNAFDAQAGEVHKFYVDPAFRGRRIGHALMAAALDAIRQAAHRTGAHDDLDEAGRRVVRSLRLPTLRAVPDCSRRGPAYGDFPVSQHLGSAALP
ncbi:MULTISPECIES: GNAT family N-acetyltransferase [unclassified Rhizobium]|uniref:GNAT family N-acetyltransferase n=1 Tax=unclassified Rhizobium TaxID=2613769 RepID=UPI00160DDC5D|nr:GNAT superfamily N-acetyltransferase [Rhizobium sp. BK181]MBB3545449.1 GNAT superfamily N-acetyltransferase [Rhizobium sp. BK399]MCS3743197.1 GNAT superfamily N-acetyltransferase [Rhizobium sp. BK661]MCS4096568.1 GNAT superfamily N-acetyltransferase [Rhizobium sp. BK176]